MSSNIRVKRICQYCGKDFQVRTTVTQYCSDPCAKRAYKQRQRDAKVEKSNSETAEIKLNPLTEIKGRDYLTVKEAAFLLRCTPRAVNKMIKSGRLRAVMLSERKTIIKREDIDQLFVPPMPEVVFRLATKKKPYKIEDCYTIAEAEKVSQMSSAALYNYIRRNDISKYQKGKYVYVPKELIDLIAK